MKQLKNYLSILSMLIALSLLTFISCTPDTEKEDLICKVSVEISDGGIGVVSNTEVISGEEVTLKAVPEATYRFVNWTVNGKEVSKENPYTTTITTTTQFKANFEKDNYKVTVIAGEGGTAEATKEGDVLNGTEVTFTATPAEGYSFINWTVNGEEVSTEKTYTTTITKDIEIKANFITHKVTVVAGEGGKAEANKTQVATGVKVTFTATPQENYGFVNWTVNGTEVSTKNPYTATITEDIEIKANFATYKVTVVSGEGGKAEANKTQVGHNAKVTLTATPNNDYHFVNWTVNGTGVSTKNQYTATITEDIEFKANFRETYKPTGAENSHEYVDLGLSVKWATCNVGATTPEEYGDYFAWGETEPKDVYGWSTYKYCNGYSNTITKYYVSSFNGPTIDNKKVLELEDDAAHVNWGGNWRMPTLDEIGELLYNSKFTWTLTTKNGVKGYKVTSEITGNSIFFPVAGYRYADYLKADYCSYWSSTLDSVVDNTKYNTGAFCLVFGNTGWNSFYRCNGLSVRPVCE